MKPSIVKAIKSAIKNGLKRLLVEVLLDDSQEHTVFTMPGIETIPLKDEKCLLIPLDKTGKAVVLGVQLKTDIKDGEIKINGRSETGIIKGSLYIKNDGQIEIGLTNFQGVVTELFKNFYDTHTHNVDISKAITLAPIIPMPDIVISSKVKVE